jgi:hypothetical protein
MKKLQNKMNVSAIENNIKNYSLFETELKKFNKMYGDYLYEGMYNRFIETQLSNEKIKNHFFSIARFENGIDGELDFIPDNEYLEVLNELLNDMLKLTQKFSKDNGVEKVILMDYTSSDCKILTKLWFYYYIWNEFYDGDNYFLNQK